MVELSGTAVAGILVLGYIVVVQALTAAIVLLSEFIVLRLRVVLSLVAEKRTPQKPPSESEPPATYRLGGDLKW